MVDIISHAMSISDIGYRLYNGYKCQRQKDGRNDRQDTQRLLVLSWSKAESAVPARCVLATKQAGIRIAVQVNNYFRCTLNSGGWKPDCEDGALCC
jgi:hypothetical protein